jgi:hypothetical protein
MSSGQYDDRAGFPVTVAVRRPDGQVEQVRVGTAFKAGDGFTLKLGEMSIGGTPVAAAPARAAAGPSAAAGGGEGMVFPPYGRSKGMPIAGASLQDLEFYASGSRRSLADPGKSRWHDKERVLLAAIEAEITRQTGEPPPPRPPEGMPTSASSGRSAYQDDVPPPGDDDVPF